VRPPARSSHTSCCTEPRDMRAPARCAHKVANEEGRAGIAVSRGLLLLMNLRGGNNRECRWRHQGAGRGGLDELPAMPGVELSFALALRTAHPLPYATTKGSAHALGCAGPVHSQLI
jgi:hypothetical protein